MCDFAYNHVAYLVPVLSPCADRAVQGVHRRLHSQTVQFKVCTVDYIVHVLSMSGKVLVASYAWLGTKSVSSPLDA